MQAEREWSRGIGYIYIYIYIWSLSPRVLHDLYDSYTYIEDPFLPFENASTGASETFQALVYDAIQGQEDKFIRIKPTSYSNQEVPNQLKSLLILFCYYFFPKLF